MLKNLLVLAIAVFPALAIASSSTVIQIAEVRTYESGFIVFTNQQINPDCLYPGHLQLYRETNPNYETSVSLFMTAWALNKPIRAYIGGCGKNKNSPNGNVHVTGWRILE